MKRFIIRLWVLWIYFKLRRDVFFYRSSQNGLHGKYGLDGVEPEGYTDSLRNQIKTLAEANKESAPFAWTSGTTSLPKQIFYPKHRLKKLQQTYVDQVLLAYHHLNLKRPAFYFLASLEKDNSVSGLLIRERLSNFYSYMLSESIIFEENASSLVGKYSQEAIHLLLLILSKPTLIAMANPSSLYILLDKVRKNWPSFQKEMIEITNEPQFRTTLARFRDNKSPAMTLIKQQDAPSAAQLLPALTTVYCWDSGYVGPFIDNLRTKLRDLPLEFFPMFSMSTETVAYEIYPQINMKGGLPIYSGVCYEFLKEDSPISSKNLSAPWNLEAGKFYQMVVSDAYGLKRYLTGDLFECLGFYSSVPILRFVGREGLNYSFTGEKITAQQLLEVYDKAVRNGLKKEGVLTCFPKLNKDSVPSYVFVCCLENETQATVSLSAETIDRFLMEINSEYASKRKSGRLAEPELVVDSYESIMGKLIKADPRYKNSSTAQFKPLPLYKIYWEDLQKGKRE